MSTLIEALSLVVRHADLDMRFPGGPEAFLKATLEFANPPRYCASADAHLVSVSFYDAEHILPAVALLRDHGFTDVEDDRVVDIAYVDQRYGPTMPCEWLEWERHPLGFTHAWLAGTKPGDMAAPVGWTVEQSLDLTRHDIRDEQGRTIRLSEHNGIESWLDLSTGKVMINLAPREDAGTPRAQADETPPTEAAEPAPSSRGKQKVVTDGLFSNGVPDLAAYASDEKKGGPRESLAKGRSTRSRQPARTKKETPADGPVASAPPEVPATVPPSAESPTIRRRSPPRPVRIFNNPAGPLTKKLLAAVAKGRMSWEVTGILEWISISVPGKYGTYDVQVTVEESLRTVQMYTNIPIFVPAARRGVVAQAFAWMNYYQEFGNFDLSVSDGQMRYRYGVAFGDGEAGVDMLLKMITNCHGSVDRQIPRLMKLLYAPEPEAMLRQGGWDF